MELTTFFQTYNLVKTVGKLAALYFKILTDEADSLFADIAKVHYTSACQAFDAASNSNTEDGTTAEIRVGIGHLRDAFNYLDTYSKSTKTTFFFFKTYPNKLGSAQDGSNIAMMISLFHDKVGDKQNASSWARKSIDKFSEYENIYRQEAREWSTSRVEDSAPPSVYAQGQKFSHYVFSQSTYDHYLSELKMKKQTLRKILKEFV
jgi:hypothetical protein